MSLGTARKTTTALALLSWAVLLGSCALGLGRQSQEYCLENNTEQALWVHTEIWDGGHGGHFFPPRSAMTLISENVAYNEQLRSPAWFFRSLRIYQYVTGAADASIYDSAVPIYEQTPVANKYWVREDRNDSSGPRWTLRLSESQLTLP